MTRCAPGGGLDVHEHAGERARHAADIERLDQRPKQLDLPVGREAAQLLSGRPGCQIGTLTATSSVAEPRLHSSLYATGNRRAPLSVSRIQAMFQPRCESNWS